MIRVRIFFSIFTLALAIAWLVPSGMRAQDTNKAALVIRLSETSVATECVEFPEDEITGLELLQRSGLDFGVDVQGLGAIVCRIDQTGCSSEDCWCQCKGGGDCIYWSYWHQIDNDWQYSQAGAAVYAVRDGAVDGWSWGPGAVNAALAPPDLSFDDICGEAAGNVGDATPTSSPTPIIFMPQNTPESNSPPLPPAHTATSLPTVTGRAAVATVATVSPIPTNTLTPTPTAVIVEETPVAGAIPSALNTPAPATQIPTLAVADTTAQREAESAPVTETAEVQQGPQIIAESPVIVPTASAQMPEAPSLASVEINSVPTPRLTVVGSGVQAEQLYVQPPTAKSQAALPQRAEIDGSPYEYVTFGLIMLTLLSLSAVTHARRKERLGTRNEPRSRV